MLKAFKLRQEANRQSQNAKIEHLARRRHYHQLTRWQYKQISRAIVKKWFEDYDIILENKW